ncbi:hypothetical protein LI192_13990 [Enterococcus avium]|uniref:hypothetical protein n=1 Tax=Enterococcus avium TaxID=33945 RepID=UPI001D05CB40|nr:hypothetical protein [Enterococcus avium]MCB6530458.1 hypothetical protein [Enterococcus avium]MCG4868247.1 hypothetical protein [Enterococcus avium]MCQ4676457.1 hypothetical protein [Enterococcus avium]
MDKKIEIKQIELNKLKKELETIKNLPYGGMPLAFEVKRVEKRYKQLEKEINELKESN